MKLKSKLKYFIRDFEWMKVYFSPFKPPIPRFYIGKVAVGRSLLMSPFNPSFTWQTTLVTEIVEQREDYIKFKTENSNYELFKLTNND